AANGRIANYDAYRTRADAATQKGLREADAPNAVVDAIVRLIGTAEPRFSNPVRRLTRVMLLLRCHALKLFEAAVRGAVRPAR
ncbi:MAG: short-chain dehydrogenase/reductase, partial [Rhodoferax sp.]|nr:short-chain dehydrogenase/reductase [Rhodoferax sp.]